MLSAPYSAEMKVSDEIPIKFSILLQYDKISSTFGSLSLASKGASLSRSACTPFRRVSVALQAHMPAVHPEMTIWGVKEGPPHFLWLNYIFFVS